ncbi:metallophosphoesterase [Actinoplanes cyaneus]|uniref:Metallophosphoesterase n=1 Tax=Actinoplanes cyaneus TaxID=52696 RepID=A0A919MH39_9ACTN|nr:metallophosphoesterase [Actinoplanes cyaneus]MCW2142383.1 3',5'-cyclic AMP phosphodiesterase CpdA [Actinoplanes cyaneus]GID70881.1 metallophosphoesterase [Actinoplanes cyaneus]
MPTLFAISDLHVAYRENRDVLEGIQPSDDGDWLIVAGDVGEIFGDVVSSLRLLAGRFAKVIWSPGNHELWTPREDPEQSRGVARYERLVAACRELGVSTPEDEYPVWEGAGGRTVVAPLFLLYDYSFRLPGQRSKAESLAYAHETGVVCTDEILLHPEPYASREQWCWARVEATEKRLAAIEPDLPTVLVNHWPMVREPTRILRFPEFAQWCGTELTADWHVRFRTTVSVYGHLHIPRTTTYDGVRFEEVSLGYPREWRRRGTPPGTLRRILG